MNKAEAKIKNIIKIAIGEQKKKKKKRSRKLSKKALTDKDVVRSVGNLVAQPAFYNFGRDLQDLKINSGLANRAINQNIDSLRRDFTRSQRDAEMYREGFQRELAGEINDLYGFVENRYERLKRRGNPFATKPPKEEPREVKFETPKKESRSQSEPRSGGSSGGAFYSALRMPSMLFSSERKPPATPQDIVKRGAGIGGGSMADASTQMTPGPKGANRSAVEIQLNAITNKAPLIRIIESLGAIDKIPDKARGQGKKDLSVIELKRIIVSTIEDDYKDDYDMLANAIYSSILPPNFQYNPSEKPYDPLGFFEGEEKKEEG